MCLHKILLTSLKRRKPAKPKVHNAAILKSFNEAPANLSIIFLMRSVLIGSFFTMGLPFALFADSITFLAHETSSGFGLLIGTNEWNQYDQNRVWLMLVGEEILTTWAGANFQGLAAKTIWKKEKKSRALQGNDQIYALLSVFFFFITPRQTTLESPVPLYLAVKH